MTAVVRDQSFSSPDVCRLAGVTFRMLDHWTRTGIVTPSVFNAHGSGQHRRWSRADVVVVAAIAGFGQWWLRRIVAPELYAAADLDGWLVLDVEGRRAWALTSETVDRIPDLVRECGAVTVVCLRGLVDFEGS